MIHLPAIFTELKEQQTISESEYEFIRFLHQQNPDEKESVLLAAASCLQAQNHGNVCLDLNAMDDRGSVFERDTSQKGLRFGELKSEWLRELPNSPLVSDGRELKPLILDQNRLYLHRFWKYEQELVKWLKTKTAVKHELNDEIRDVLNLFVKQKKDETDWQDVALILSFLKDLVVITGGPGTGKTFTVLKIIAAQNHLMDGNLKVAVAAPTGKASRRLSDSIRQGKKVLPPELQEKIPVPDDALTVHKLLGADYQGNRFRYNQENKLPYDLIIIDEASMLDIHLWVHLIRAVPENAKLVVLGDKDQLASVEAGSILGDICLGDNSFSAEVCRGLNEYFETPIAENSNMPAINDSIVFLNRSYRFDESSGIKKLADAINKGDAAEVMALLKSNDFADLRWLDLTASNIDNIINEYAIEHYSGYQKLNGSEALAASKEKKILCALRRGKLGSEYINRKVEERIHRNFKSGAGEWYEGRIIMATRNDNVLKLRNGEMGICSSNENPAVLFEGENKIPISASRLKDYEPAFAITIHKSQGSEYEKVAVLLPEKMNAILSKEILYTSVTRARRDTLIVGSEEVITGTVEHSIKRNSGLRSLLWE